MAPGSSSNALALLVSLAIDALIKCLHSEHPTKPNLVLNNYGPTLYAGLGYNSDQQFNYQIGWLTLAFGSGLLACVFVEWFPRPKLIAFGILWAAVCLACEAALVATYATPEALQNPNGAALRAAVAVSDPLSCSGRDKGLLTV